VQMGRAAVTLLRNGVGRTGLREALRRLQGYRVTGLQTGPSAHAGRCSPVHARTAKELSCNLVLEMSKTSGILRQMSMKLKLFFSVRYD
jgi:DNA-binding FadR family transcriptional regulator